MIPAIGTITNSIWGYYMTASSGYSIPGNIPTWIITNTNGAWSPSRQAPNGHSYAFPLCAPCPIKIYSGSINSATSSFSPSPQIQFITTSIAGNDLFLPTPSTAATANYEKFYAPVLAQDGCFYAFDYAFVSASGTIRESSTVGKIMKLDPSIDRYTTYSFTFPTVTSTSGVRMTSTILGNDGYIYGIPNAVSYTNNNNRIFRFHPSNPTLIESSSNIGSGVNTSLVGAYIGTLSSRPGAIYWIPRAPSTAKTLAIVLSSSQFSAGTVNGISTVSLPTDLTSTTNDLAYWPSKGHENTGYTYWAPRINTLNATLGAKALVLDPYGGTVGTGSFTLDNNTDIYNDNGTGGNFTFSFARSFNGDLFALPYTNHKKQIIINATSSGYSFTSSFYPVDNSLSTRYLAIYPSIMSNGLNICPNILNITPSIFPTTTWVYFMSVKGYYKNVTNFVEKSSYIPPTNIASITSSLYNWLENNTGGS